MHSTFIYSLLASALSAQVLGAPVDSALPSFAIVTPGATIEPPNTSTKSTQIPASLSFNPSKAPAFTASSGVPNISNGPVYSSTPCSSQVTPTPQVPSSEEATPIKPSSAALPIQTPTPEGGDDEDLPPCDEDEDEPEVADTPSPASTPRASAVPISEFPSFSTGAPVIPIGAPLPTGGLPPFPTGGRPPFPTGGRPPFPIGTGYPGFGRGRPRPTGAWPSRGAPRPTGGFHFHPPAGSAPQGPGFGVSKGAAASTPCTTLETRVRPTATQSLLA